MKYRGINLDGNTIGVAYLGTMCTEFSNGLVQDGGSPITSVIAIAAHEVGHNFNMQHDDGNIEIYLKPIIQSVIFKKNLLFCF